MTTRDKILAAYEEVVSDYCKNQIGSARLIQNREEAVDFIQFAMEYIKSDTVRFMEIGVRLGGSFAFWGRTLRQFYPSVSGIALDLPCTSPRPGAEGSQTEPLSYFLGLLNLNFPYSIVAANSHFDSSLKAVENILAGEKLDMLFIDGDHTVDGVTMDFDMYKHLVKNGGIIGFHDIVEPKMYPWVEVHKAWPNIKSRFSSDQIREWKHDGEKFGIGAIVV
jgi:hypothetical protein